MRWIVYDLFCLVFAMKTIKQHQSGGTTFHVTREQATWLMNNNVNPGDYFRAAIKVPAHERRALAIRMAEEADERYIALKEERKAHEWAAIQCEEMHALVNEILTTSDTDLRAALCLQLGECYGEAGLDALDLRRREIEDADIQLNDELARDEREFNAAKAREYLSFQEEAWDGLPAWEAKDPGNRDYQLWLEAKLGEPNAPVAEIQKELHEIQMDEAPWEV